VWDNPVQLVLDTLGGKWRMLVLWRLKDRSLPFGDLRRAVERNLVGGTLTDRAWTLHVRALERHRLIDRSVVDGPPRRVTYSIAPVPPVESPPCWRHLSLPVAIRTGRVPP
jgi:DNA-binding HxlR family transcriptional regulator